MLVAAGHPVNLFMGIKPFSHNIQEQAAQPENIQAEGVFMETECIVEIDP
jgi:hypothetical protein